MSSERYESSIWHPSNSNDFRPRAQRRKCRITTRIMVSLHEGHAVITNLSRGGVGLTTDPMVKLRSSEPVTIACAELGEITCTVRWCAHPNYGLEFGPRGQESATVRSYYDSLSPDIE